MRESLQLLGVWTAVAIAAVPLLSRAAQAWGDQGHMIVAAISQKSLNDKAKARVAKLIAADKDGLSAKDYVSRATWADRYRDSDRNTTKIRYNATRQWHFVDINIDTPDFDAACFGHPSLGGAVASKGPAKSCVVDKIEQFRAELADPATSKQECLLAFKFILHFVGDLHQPLHASDRKDQGGNSKWVQFGSKKSVVKLHSYWDSLPKDIGSVDGATKALTKQFDGKKKEWMAGTPAQWAQGSFDKAKSFAYDLPKKTFTKVIEKKKQTVFPLSPTYEKNAADVAREQLAKGGMRLALVLNEALGQDSSCVTAANFP